MSKMKRNKNKTILNAKSLSNRNDISTNQVRNHTKHIAKVTTKKSAVKSGLSSVGNYITPIYVFTQYQD